MSINTVQDDTWDPNWRGFIGTTFIVILEEFHSLLPQTLQDNMLQSLHLNAIGDTYRVGGVDDDNLYPEYSNAAIMHATVSGWVGRKTGDTNLTADGEKWASDIVALFDRNGTLSEFNGPTYAGVSLFGLTLWAKYLPQDSVMGANGGRMITAVWDSIGSLYNANLKNIAGPWDRSYGFDMIRYLSIISLYIWTLIGLPASPLYHNPQAVAHTDDFEIGPLVAILAPFHSTFVSPTALASLTTFPGTHFVHTSAYSPFADLAPRNYTTYLSPGLTIGAQSFSENVIGGPSINPSQFNPVVAQWEREEGNNSIGFFSLYAQEKALQADVGEGRLELWYPEGNCSSTFTFLVSPNDISGPRNVRSWEDVKGISVNVSAGTVDFVPTIAFCGLRGGLCDAINGFDVWNITYYMPEGSTAIPSIVLDIALE
ncbi:related to OrfH-unknown, trichothecene gene cluster [Ramularia collo-cygni]|uniref:Uncharacterized protein n=1 Tax=Ramularia collo-cygni TaxID=112498 RepID=A0A2D3UPF4_9PEZI|nr:related to OrfH-unknown, trichothecene gene cluster [Ramularia collo-cygni]CZT14735.1 related to OrfH-unknown, trichothecene gene cluster [Ramularia collo-cygni]